MIILIFMSNYYILRINSTIQTYFRIACGFVALEMLWNENVFPEHKTNTILMTATIIIVTEKTIKPIPGNRK